MLNNRISLPDMILVAMFAALTAVGAWISFPLPFGEVPVVLANMFVLLSGVILGKWLGALSQVVYVLLGVIGVPVFAQFTAGPGVLAGPTGGYLVGYIIGAFVAGALVEYLPRRIPEIARVATGLIIGGLVIYIPGVAWLASYLDINVHAALVAGFYPFLPGDAIKIVIATILATSLMQQVPRIRGIAVSKLAESEEVG
jgi:biotin transport system substrate-specific component